MKNHHLQTFLSLLLFWIALLSIISCKGVKKNDFKQYNLVHEYQKLFLHHDLDEVSGLSYAVNGVAFAINNEEGILFKIDLRDGSIREKVEFGDHRDYEGITPIDSTVYMVESGGDLF